jgi:hypothetical protein
MTTDRTQPARPVAPNDRSSAAPAERRPEGAFAALLDAHAPPQGRRDDPRGPEGRRDEAHGRREGGAEPREVAHLHDAEPAHADVRPDQSPRVAPDGSAPAIVPQAGRPVAAVPFVAVIEPSLPVAEAAAPAPAAPAAPAASLFMIAPEAPIVAAPVVTEAAAPASLPSTPAAAAPQITTTPAEPTPAQAAPAPAAAPEARQTPEPAAPAAESPIAPEAAPEAPAAAPARVAAAAEPATAAAPAPQAPAGPVATAPAPTPTHGLAAPERAVPLHRAPAAVGTLLHVAVERGISRAKMALRPAELGGIEIRLQATAGGVAAQVVADSPEAARLLAQAGDDLRRALEARDVTLISLEVSTSGDQQQQSARGEWTDGGDAGLSSSHGREAGDAEPVPTTQTVIELPGGLLVDVLA